jgi:hypothetical protein
MQYKQLLPEAKVRERYGVSSMTLWRWDRNSSLNFPPALRINNRKYRDSAKLDAFDEARLRDGRRSR